MMDLPPNWTEYFTDDGLPYYHNPILNITQWERPTESELGENYANRNDKNFISNNTLSLADDKSYAIFSITPNNPVNVDIGQTQTPVNTNNQWNVDGTIDSNTRYDSSSNWQDITTESGGVVNTFFHYFCCCNLSAIEKYFDVTTSDVVCRCKSVLSPSTLKSSDGTSNVAENMKTKPDLYGPFWISTTIIVFLFVIRNSPSVISGKNSDADYGIFGISSLVIYGVLGILPLASKLLLYATNSSESLTSLSHVYCVYGYSLFSLVPMSIASLIQVFMHNNVVVAVVEWTVLVICLLISFYFLWCCLFHPCLMATAQAQTTGVVMFVALVSLVHLALFLTFKVIFLSQNSFFET